jgi:disulfide bond formation protein DsbB
MQRLWNEFSESSRIALTQIRANMMRSVLTALGKIFKGSGECAEVGWTFLGLSLAEWSLAWFALFGAFAVWLAFMAMRRAKGSIDRGPA